MKTSMPQPKSIRELSAIAWVAIKEEPTSIRQLSAIPWVAVKEQLPLPTL